jgi:hypothetical protein
MRSERQSKDSGEIEQDDPNLDDLLRETRILLPGSEVFLAFLTTLPFTQRFSGITSEQRSTFLCTFFAALIAFACFVTPAAYHRIARPIRDKKRFKLFASRMLVIGLAPMSLSLVLVTYLVASVVLDGAAVFAAFAIGLVIAVLWWIVPLLRVHDRFGRKRGREMRHGEV